MNTISMKQRVQQRLGQLHREQSGAVALLVLAAILIIFMISLVIFDTGRASRDKITVSAAADAAAWSQSSIEARSMNMIAFSNVAKRVTFGMTSYYVALWLAYTELLVLGIALSVACWIANIPTFGALTPICQQVTEFTVKIGIIMGKEAPDLGVFAGDLNSNYFGRDMKALNSYQEYMMELTPWWGWSEQFLRGTRNGASMTASFPAPKLLPSSVSSMLSQSGKTDSLPVQKDDPSKNYSNMCKRVIGDWDIVVHVADYALKSGPNACTSGGWQPPVICALTGLLAVPNMIPACKIQEKVFGDEGAPYDMKKYSSAEEWQLDSSNLVFAYKSGDKRMNDDEERKKYGFLKDEHDQDSLIYKSGGYWGMARSEISFQGGKPSAWYPSWTARMRPVSLPGEWQSDIELSNAWRDVAPYMILGAALDKIVDSDGATLEGAAADLLRIELSTSAMGKDNVPGVSR